MKNKPGDGPAAVSLVLATIPLLAFPITARAAPCPDEPFFASLAKIERSDDCAVLASAVESLRRRDCTFTDPSLLAKSLSWRGPIEARYLDRCSQPGAAPPAPGAAKSAVRTRENGKVQRPVSRPGRRPKPLAPTNPISSRPAVTDGRNLMQEARSNFLTVSDLLQKCPDDERKKVIGESQMRAAVFYLRMVLDWEGDVQRARDDVGLLLGPERSQRARAAGVLANDSAVRKEIDAYFDRLAQLGEVVPAQLVAEVRSAKPTLEGLLKLLEKYPALTKRILYRIDLATGTHSLARSAMDQSRRSLVVIVISSRTDLASAQAKQICSGSDDFLAWLDKRNVEPGPIRAAIRAPSTMYDRWRAQVPCVCGGKHECPVDQEARETLAAQIGPGPCTAMLTIKLSPEGDKEKATGTLTHFFESTTADPRFAVSEIVGRPYAVGCTATTMDDQIAAAGEFVESLAAHYDVIFDAPAVVNSMTVVPAFHPGVARKSQPGNLERSDLADRRGVVIKEQCNGKFDGALRVGLKGFAPIVGSLDSPKPGAPILTLSIDRESGAASAIPGTPSKSTEWCLATLSQGDHTLRLWARPTKDDRWEDAGTDVATQIGGAYLGAMYGDATRRPSPWSSLLLSGLANLRDPYANHAAGWSWAGVDLGMTAAGGLLLYLGLRERNAFADHPSGRPVGAERMVNVGLGLFGVVLIERLISVATYQPSPLLEPGAK